MPKGGNGGGGKPGGGGSVTFAILGLDDISDTGVSQGDDLTNLSTGFTLTGTIDPSIESFTLTINGTDHEVTSINPDGSWAFTYEGPNLLDGPVLVEASYTTIHPKNGKVQTKSAEPYTFELDSQIDQAAITGITSDTGNSSTDGVTNDISPIVSGLAEVGATVELYDNGKFVGTTTADASGNWSITLVGPLGDGNHSLTATVSDLAGNSVDSAAFLVTVDTVDPVAPQVTAVFMADESTLAPGGVTDDNTPVIQGTAEAGTTVEVFADGVSIGTTMADVSGNWSITSVALVDAVYTVTAQATDLAGNTSVLSTGFQIEIDAINDPPPPPTTTTGWRHVYANR